MEFSEVTLPTPTLLRLSPYEIQAPEELNTRRFQTPRDSILSLARSLIEDGQQEPVGVIQLPDSTYLLKYGWRRWQAACLILEEGLDRDHISEPFTLLALVSPSTPPGKGTPSPDLIAGIIENTQREQLGPVDQAYAIKLLSDSGVRQRHIAQRMNISQSLVPLRLRLLDLPTDMQRQVNAGTMSADEALRSLDPLPPPRVSARQGDAASAISDTDVRIDQTLINTDSNVLNQDSPAEAFKPNKPKTVKQIVEELHQYATPEGYDPKRGRTAAQAWVLTKLIAWINTGKRGFGPAMEALERMNLNKK
jgi:ParB-like chromosome segregation protein Spo0J